MINHPKVFSLLFVFFFFTLGYAQQAVVSTGGDGSGTGGSYSSSTGLTDFQYFSNDFWSIQFGMLQTHKAHVVNIDPNPPEGGTIIGGGNHSIGSEVSLFAQADQGWEFVMWIGNFLELSPDKYTSQSTSNPIVILIQEDTYIMAVFQIVEPVAVPVSNWSIYLGMIIIVMFAISRFNRSLF